MERIIKIPWKTGLGNIIVKEDAGGNVSVTSDTPADSGNREQEVKYYTTNTTGNKAETMQTVKQNQLLVERKIIQVSDLPGQTSLASLFPMLKDKKYYVLAWLCGAGGNGGGAGSGWGLYKGGSGGAGANGNIVCMAGIVDLNTPLELIRNSNFNQLKNNGANIASAYDGGSGTNGSNASWTGAGGGGTGGSSNPASINETESWANVVNYHDPKANNGSKGGAEGSNVPIHALPGTRYDEYAKAGVGNANGGVVPATGKGCVAIEVYHLEEDYLQNIVVITTSVDGIILKVLADIGGDYTDIILKKGNNVIKGSDIKYGFKFNNSPDPENVIDIFCKTYDTSNIYDFSDMFSNTGIEELDLSGLDTSNVTNVSDMFSGCSRLKSVKLPSFNTGKVNYSNQMFFGCSKLEKIDLSSFDMSNLKNAHSMFRSCDSLQEVDLSNLNPNSTIFMTYMFDGCFRLKHVNFSSLDASKAEINVIFRGCSSLTKITCKQSFKDKCLADPDNIELPDAMREGGSGTWVIVP